MRPYSRVHQVIASQRAARAYRERFNLTVHEADGLRRVAFARSTGTLVSVYNAGEAGLDPESGAWVSMCEDHGRLVNHDSRVLAEAHAAAPEGFCGVCAGTEDPDE